MRPLPPRPHSRSARWAVRIALFSLMLGCITVLVHRASIIETGIFLTLLKMVFLFAILALALTASALHSLWTRGKKGGRKASWALFVCVIVLLPYLASTVSVLTKPQQTDVSSDVIDPPLFALELDEGGTNAVAVVAGQLREGYPQLTGERYRSDHETVMEAALLAAARQGLNLVTRRGRAGADDDLIAEFTYRTALLYMPGQAVLRVSDEGDTTFVDLRARSIFGEHDRGYNAALISRFFRDLDYALIGASR